MFESLGYYFFSCLQINIIIFKSLLNLTDTPAETASPPQAAGYQESGSQKKRDISLQTI
jgi:hypothetical protein